MPTYVYKCSENNHLFEMVQKFSDKPGANCPTCGSNANRQISAPTVIYKGSGFYTTDYGSGSSPNSKTNEKPSSSPSDSDSGSSANTSSSDSPGNKSTGKSDTSGTGNSHSHGSSTHTH